jgi:sugar-specific transcriptional regulator TrmB
MLYYVSRFYRPKMNTIHLLTKFGLTNNEALIYTALVKLTEASAYSLSKETKIPKTSIYEILDSLKNKGFISKSIINKSAYFTAESPNRFLSTANEKIDIAKLLIPALQSIHQDVGKDGPSIKFYTGVEGAKKAFEDILITLKKTGVKEIFGIIDQDMQYFLPRYLPTWLERREKLNIFTYLLTHSENNTEPEIYKSNKLRETRLISREYILSTTMDIYATKVVIFSHKDNAPYAIIIDSEHFAETLKKIFHFMWNFAEKVEKK